MEKDKNRDKNDIAKIADVFYIGGTKVGALFGEAVVITNPEILKHFTPLVKQHGALLAKGRLLGLQFEALFADGLYFEIGKETVRKAMDLRKAFEENGFKAELVAEGEHYDYLARLTVA